MASEFPENVNHKLGVNNGWTADGQVCQTQRCKKMSAERFSSTF